MAGKIAYTMSRFPHLPETFILREMEELRGRGWDIAPYPLLVQREAVMHEETGRWLGEVREVPFLSRQGLVENGRALGRAPLKVAGVWWRAVAENARDPYMLSRTVALLPKAGETAFRMAAEGVTHIHAHYATHPALLAWIVHQLTGIPYSVTVHAHDIFVHRAMLVEKLRAARFIVAISRYNRDYLAEAVGPWIRERTHVVHCGISPDRYRPRIPGTRRRRLQIINVGSLQPYKGHAYLIEACARLRERGIPFECRIIGGGAGRESLQHLIERRGLGDQVSLLGPLPQDRVAALLPTADCYVQPSIVTPSGKKEGIPVALMEALACRVPVIATRISGIPELVTDGETGYLVPPADTQALFQALVELYEAPEAAEATAAAGRRRVLEEFDLRRNVAALASLFERYARQDVGNRALIN